MNKARNLAIGLGLAAAGSLSGVDAGAFPIAGVAPDARPEGAPVIRQTEQDDVWRDRAREGISQPYPPNLKFLDDQGNWYTPFDRPNMPGRYDIRGLHQPGGEPRS